MRMGASGNGRAVAFVEGAKSTENLKMQRRTPLRVPARLPPRSPAVPTSVDISDSSDDAGGDAPPSSRGKWQRGPQGRGGTGSSSAHSSRKADPSSSDLSDSDDSADRGARKAPVYKAPSRAASRDSGRESPIVRHGGKASRPTTASMNRGLGGSFAGDDLDMIEQAIGRQQHGIKRAGHNAVSRAIDAARHHNQNLSDSEISASSDEGRRVPLSVSRASMAAVQRSQVHCCMPQLRFASLAYASQ